MLSTLSPDRRPARTVGARPGAAALAIGGVLLAGGLLLAGCSGSASSSGATALPPAPGAAARAAPGVAPGGPAASAAAGSTARSSGAGTTARLAPAGDIIYTAQLTVRAANVGTAAARAAQIAEDVGGYVSNESTSANPDHPSQAAAIQLKIPVASYPATLGQLASSLGTQLSLQEQAQDVTEQVADVNSQVTSFQAAIAQLRALLSHAGSIGDLLSVQNQINDEESALEALQAQQRALSHETTYATVTLTILGPKAKPAVHHPKAPPSLAGGFGTGWHALRVTVSWVLAFLGVVVPFAAVAALAGYLVYQGRRWLIRRRPAARPASPEN